MITYSELAVAGGVADVSTRLAVRVGRTQAGWLMMVRVRPEKWSLIQQARYAASAALARYGLIPERCWLSTAWMAGVAGIVRKGDVREASLRTCPYASPNGGTRNINPHQEGHVGVKCNASFLRFLFGATQLQNTGFCLLISPLTVLQSFTQGIGQGR